MANVELEVVDGNVGVITLNRPERLNALSFPMVGDLHDVLDEAAGHADLKALVLAGAGKGFCSGLDLRDWGEVPTPGTHPHWNARTTGQSFIADLTTHLRDTPQIVVAAVKGVAFGGGLSLACAADVRIASASARFCSAFIRTGLSGTDIGISYLLPRLVGASRAWDLIISGREIDGVEAERIGLVSQVVDDDDPLDAALAYARGVAQYTRTGLTLTKEALWHNLDAQSLDAAVALENRNQLLASAAPDVKEYMAAYAKRTTG